MFAGRLKLVTAPAAAVMTTAEAKLFLRVDDNGEDALIDSIVEAATKHVESYINRKLINQTWNYFLDYFPQSYNSNHLMDGVQDGAITDLYSSVNEIKIPLGNLQSIAHLKTYDDADVAYTMPGTDYQVDTSGAFGRVVLRIGSVWPSTILRNANGIEIQGVFGFGASSASVPAPLLSAIKLIVAAMYERRGDELMKLPALALTLAKPYRIENI